MFFGTFVKKLRVLWSVTWPLPHPNNHRAATYGLMQSPLQMHREKKKYFTALHLFKLIVWLPSLEPSSLFVLLTFHNKPNSVIWVMDICMNIMCASTNTDGSNQEFSQTTILFQSHGLQI